MSSYDRRARRRNRHACVRGEAMAGSVGDWASLVSPGAPYLLPGTWIVGGSETPGLGSDAVMASSPQR
jgi:hypothetical protein